MKKQLHEDNIAKAEKGIIYENLWKPWEHDRDTRGISSNWHHHNLRKVSVLEAVAIPRPDGSFTRQLWLATAGMSFYGARAQGSEEEDVATWAGGGLGQCPPWGNLRQLACAVYLMCFVVQGQSRGSMWLRCLISLNVHTAVSCISVMLASPRQPISRLLQTRAWHPWHGIQKCWHFRRSGTRTQKRIGKRL